MKKVLHLQLLPLMSGVQRFSLHLLDGLDRQEYDIWVACKPGGEFVDEVKSRGFHFVPLPSFCHPISYKDFFTFLHLIRLFKKERFDIVHTNSSKPGLLGRFAAKLCGVPLIIHTAHGTPFQLDQSRLVYSFYALLEFFGNAFGHKTVYVNNSDRANCTKMHLIPERKARTIYNAIPPEMQSRLDTIANQRNMPSAQIIIGSTLRFSTQKNVIRLVSAACRACKKAPKLKFILLGEGEHYQLCRSIVHAHNMSSQVILPGWDSNVIPWLEAFDAFVLYSRWEAQPFSIIEAMSSGLPVIGSAIPSIKELVNNDTGYLVALDDDKALEELFLQHADDFSQAYAKGKQAAKCIKQLCNYQAMVAAYEEVYRG